MRTKILVSTLVVVVVIFISVLGFYKYNSALEITKRNYKEYGYNYAKSELDDMIRDKNEDTGKYKYRHEDLNDALDFLYKIEYGMTFDEYRSSY